MDGVSEPVVFTAEPEQAVVGINVHGFGIAFLLASPIWITMQEPSNYFNFV